MTTPLYPTFQKRIEDATENLLNKQLSPWSFLNSGKPVRVKRFDGREISYEGIGFEGSPRQVFWSRYIEPFLEDLAIQEIASAVSSAREHEIDAKLLLPEIQTLLVAATNKIFDRMAEIDQKLLGKGFPNRVPRRPVEQEVRAMSQFIETRIRAELEMWKPKRWYENWYERNKFLVWILGILIAIGGLLTKLL